MVVEVYRVDGMEALLAASKASEPFVLAVQHLAGNIPQDRIRYSNGAPVVKVLRVIARVLEEEPALPIDSILVEGHSGCSTFEGRAVINDGEREYEFAWDCRWRADQEGYRDHWGMPDQARAAREFGYRCFRSFKRVQ